MKIEVAVTADRSELPEIVEMLQTVGDSPDVNVSEEEENEDVLDADLSEEERYVIAAVQESPSSALRVIHRKVTGLDGSPFSEYDRDDGWNNEREAVQSILWNLKDKGYVRIDGQRWLPTDEAPLIQVE